ncbi:hypothetical protein [Cereibacter changlensis]|uniref:hypothetical protein n=1 Tax=Cereibacter changlensis TaxID=402884 RepID=UPI00200A0A2F|nr:hypothetical protein [Cereibacter changlensis]
MRLLFLIPLLLPLAGCGSDEQSSDRVRLLRAALGAVTDRDQNRPLRPEEMGLTRAALAGITTPLALATVERPAPRRCWRPSAAMAASPPGPPPTTRPWRCATACCWRPAVSAPT